MFLIVPNDYKNRWVCYTLKDTAGTLVHMGIVKWSALTMFADVTDPLPEGDLYLTIVDHDTDRLKLANRMVPDYQWRVQEIFASWSHGNKRHGRPVVCDETGETWPSVKACCEDRGLSYSQLANHLSGAVGYKTVKGKKYRRA